MKSDRKRRKTWARIDNRQRQEQVTDARKIIYGLNRPVDCKRVELLLKSQSYVPTEVNNFLPYSIVIDTLVIFTECFFYPAQLFPKIQLI